MADFRPFSTPSPLLIFPSASPSSKLQCTPTRKPPSPIDWTKECYQGMLLETNHTQYHNRSGLIDEQNKDTQHFTNNIAREIMMDSTLRRHSTPDFTALYYYENISSTSFEPPIDTNVPSATDQGFNSAKVQSLTVLLLPESTNPPSNSSSNLSIISSSTSSMSYISSISSISSTEDNDNEDQYDIAVILKPRIHRCRHVSMTNGQNMTTGYDINHTGTSWYSSSAQSISTTLRESRYQEQFSKKKSKFSLLVAKMKRAAERPFKLMDGSNA